MVQTPMLSCPLKQTNEIDWISPLKSYIRANYGDDPEKYAEECATLNRLRQDMRGAGADSAAGRDLLYRYYGQLELLDLRFPVDENHIKISFTWYDAFTHKPTSQYSLAFEKASVIFNISAVLSCHAAVQNRSEESGVKTAYHSFQASAGMFTYINENFLHAPSQDLNRDTVKVLINITLGQGQEVFMEKQIKDGKKSALLAKLASQAHFLFMQAKEGLEGDALKGVFDASWLKFVSVKAPLMLAMAQYYQALADEEANQQGTAIARLRLAEREGKTAFGLAKSFPTSPSSSSNLGGDTNSLFQAITKRYVEMIQEKLTNLAKDNDYIYHQSIPAEASLGLVSKLAAAKAIPVSELYQGQDIQRIIGPDIFQKIVPMSVTEQASMYDEEKAKMIRSEAEKVEQANGEMAASLDYLKLPQSLNILKGGMEQDLQGDKEFERWCREMANHGPFEHAFDQLRKDKEAVLQSLSKSTKQLDMEESVCEKMRSKYGPDWTQQPSSRLTSTLRSDIKSYRDTVNEATASDEQLMNTARQYETDFEDMRDAGDREESDILWQQAVIKAGNKPSRSKTDEGHLLDEDYAEGGPTVAEQIAKVEEVLKKLNLVKRERMQVLKDLKEKVHTDDISNVLILNKKSIANHENQLFQNELEKFRSHQNRLISTVHKQSSLLKELTKAYGDLLQDKRVRNDQQKYDGIQKTRNSVLSRYKKVFNAHQDLVQGMMRAQGFYSEMKESVDSLEKNVDSFVSNRRAEGAQLLSSIEQNKSNAASGQTANEQKRLQELMERMSMEPKPSTISPVRERPAPLPLGSSVGVEVSRGPLSPSYPMTNPDPRFTIPPKEYPAPVIVDGVPQSSVNPPAPPTVPQQGYPSAAGDFGNMRAYSQGQPQPQPGYNPSDAVNMRPYGQGSSAQTQSVYNPMAYPERTVSSPPNQAPPPSGQQNFNTFSPITSPPPTNFFPPNTSKTAQMQRASVPAALNFAAPAGQYQPQYGGFQPNQYPQYQPPQLSPALSPPPHAMHFPNIAPQQYNVPQHYIPPPPPPGPPGGGSTTQYAPNTSGVWASGPGGYAAYNRPTSQTRTSNSHQQPQQSQPAAQQQPGGGPGGPADPWAGLSAWK